MIKINNKIISDKSPVFIVAEIGANHNGELNLAKESIDAACECGVDAVKFQTYTCDELLSNKDDLISYHQHSGEITQSLKKMFDMVMLKREFHAKIFEYAKKKGIICFSTPFSVEATEFLENLDNPIYKIASSDINYTFMLECIAKTKKPVFLSTGKCTLSELDKAINLLEFSGVKQLCLLHCVANYPSKMQDMNLNLIKTLKQLYPQSIVGFSDHSLGITATLGAVCFGAKIIEKHFTLDKTLNGPDHWFSMDPNDMKNIVSEVRNLECAFGDGRKILRGDEIDEKYASTRSLHANKDLKAGEKITRNDITMLRPGYGISPFDLPKILGISLRKDIKKGEVLEWKHFQS